jgi:hypothetical protein
VVVIRDARERRGGSGIAVVAVMPLGIFLSLATTRSTSCHHMSEAEAGKMRLTRSRHAVGRQEMGGDFRLWRTALLRLQGYFRPGPQWLWLGAC